MKWTRGHTHAGLGLAIGAAIAAWLVVNTEWVDVPVPPALRNEARTDPLYAFKRFAGALGVQVSTPDNLDKLPPPGATLVLGSWSWDLFPERNAALQRWVEAGGHLVVPGFDYQQDTLTWSTISATAPVAARPSAPRAASAAPPAGDATDAADAADSNDAEDADDERGGDPPTPDVEPPRRPLPPTTNRAPPRASKPACPTLVEPAGVLPAFGSARSFVSCYGYAPVLRSPSRMLWALDQPRGHVLLRVAIGRGAVTAASPRLPIYGTALFDNDEALLLAAALRLERGQQLWIVTEEKRPALLVWLWRSGAPALMLGALALALALWRAGVRFGPRIAPAPRARRSVGEQIRGTASFIAHHGGLALHRAQLRALELCARSRVAGYDALIVGERAAVLAPLVGIDAHTLARAMTLAPGMRVASALALLEIARRRLLHRSSPARRPDAA